MAPILTVRLRVRLVSLLAAAALNELFEHPANLLRHDTRQLDLALLKHVHFSSSLFIRYSIEH